MSLSGERGHLAFSCFVQQSRQKATSDLAYVTLYGFNPIFVLELTATPKDVAARGGAEPGPARSGASCTPKT